VILISYLRVFAVPPIP
jgi:hypothetical protein